MKSAACPRATYRLQLREGRTLRSALELVPYLDALGISHLYLSPILRARRGSTHGYDVVDPQQLDPSLGDAADLVALAEALRSRGMGLVLDLVPNHVGVGSGENRWWQDVLEYGRASPYAAYFDIDWDPPQGELEGRILLPFLGGSLDEVLAAGELAAGFEPETGRFALRYHELRFPLCPWHYPRIAAAQESPVPAEIQPLFAAGRLDEDRESGERLKEGLARAAESPPMRTWLDGCAASLGAGPAGRRRLAELLARQHYRLAFWRAADERINYRRFFDITHLAALRIELPEVFADVHRQILDWLDAGTIEGLRIDHVDGLWDPAAYCRELRRRAGPRLAYLVVEKILGEGEELRRDWPVEGTTGYEFLDLLHDLFVDPRGQAPLERVYRELTGRSDSFGDVLRASKLHVLEHLLGAERRALETELLAIAELDPRCDRPHAELAAALLEVLLAFPVYRTYVDDDGASASDRAIVEQVVGEAVGRRGDLQAAIRWLGRLLLADAPDEMDRELAERTLRFARRFQQLTAPLMAKSLEDTAFYRYFRLVSHNEVGGSPDRFSVSLEEFHRANGERRRRWPHALLTTATHDTKRGEDTRLRIAVLAELAADWEKKVRAFSHTNREHRREVGGRPAPEPGHELLLYQTLIGIWPFGATSADPSLRARLVGYAVKALREGKEASSWREPDELYEAAVREFLELVLDPRSGRAFLAELVPFAHRVATLAATYGLAQATLKLTTPGVPDIYQGCELWDLSLVDPDNRRPVDWNRRRAALDAVRSFGSRPPAVALDELLDHFGDGRIKLLVTERLLAERRRSPELFAAGDYRPLASRGSHSERLCAFARRHDSRSLLVSVPYRIAALTDANRPFPIGAPAWGDTRVVVPEDRSAGTFTDLLTGLPVRARGGTLAAAELFARLPVAVLVDGEELGGGNESSG